MSALRGAYFRRLIPVTQRFGALAVIITYVLKFPALFEQPFDILNTVREFFQDVEDTAFDNGHFNPLEASSDHQNACVECLLIYFKV